jgi:hypothetical protein
MKGKSVSTQFDASQESKESLIIEHFQEASANRTHPKKAVSARTQFHV